MSYYRSNWVIKAISNIPANCLKASFDIVASNIMMITVCTREHQTIFKEKIKLFDLWFNIALARPQLGS